MSCPRTILSNCFPRPRAHIRSKKCRFFSKLLRNYGKGNDIRKLIFEYISCQGHVFWNSFSGPAYLITLRGTFLQLFRCPLSATTFCALCPGPQFSCGIGAAPASAASNLPWYQNCPAHTHGSPRSRLQPHGCIFHESRCCAARYWHVQDCRRIPNWLSDCHTHHHFVTCCGRTNRPRCFAASV